MLYHAYTSTQKTQESAFWKILIHSVDGDDNTPKTENKKIKNKKKECCSSQSFRRPMMF